jgi:hypothetical protein
MIQPKDQTSNKPEVYKVGCLGKILNFSETDDKRFIINLSGIIRFKIQKELITEKLYRKFDVDYTDFLSDLDIKKSVSKNYIDENLLKKIKLFFEKINYSVKLKELEKLNFDQLVSTICMISPFSVGEKQKLIETISVEDKLNILGEILNFNLIDNQKSKTIQ